MNEPSRRYRPGNAGHGWSVDSAGSLTLQQITDDGSLTGEQLAVRAEFYASLAATRQRSAIATPAIGPKVG